MTTLMAFFLTDEFPEADMNKVIRMCMIHDLGEAFTGDIPAFDKTADHDEQEGEEDDGKEGKFEVTDDGLPAYRGDHCHVGDIGKDGEEGC